MFETERLIIRELEPDDVTDEYISWFSNDHVVEFLESKNLTKKEVLDYIEYGRKTKTYFMYAVCDKKDGKHIGNLKIGPIDKKHNTSDMPVVIGNTDYWGKGIGLEAIIKGNEIAFDVYDIRKLTGGMYEDNIKSIKAYTRSGWVEEARLKGHYILNNKVLDRVVVSCFNPKYFLGM